MRQDSYIININNPCSESWSEMTPVSGGKFCAHCSKTVIDFSKLSDEEITKIISQNNGRMCGRFLETQLNKEIIATKQTRANRSFYKYFASILLLGISKDAFSFSNNKIGLQKANITANPVPYKELNVVTDTLREIKGRVFDSVRNEPITISTIRIKGTKITSTSDSSGNFKLAIPDKLAHQNITIVLYALGYDSSEYMLTPGAFHLDRIYYLKEAQNLSPNVMVGDVVIVKHPKRKHHWWQFRK